MTIIKAYKDNKVLDKKKQDETVIILTTAESNPVEQTMQIAYMPSTRSKCIVNVFLLIIAMLVLSAGAIGGIFLFKYIANRHKVLRVTVPYNDVLTPAPDQPRAMAKQSYQTLEEDIDVIEDKDLERIEVPNFAECRRSVIMHDFNKNYTVIIDKDDSECFIMDLDRNEIIPPKSFAELIKKYTSGYYMSGYYMSGYYMSGYYMSGYYMSGYYMSGYYMSGYYMSGYYMSGYYMSGYYMWKLDVVRRNYHVVTPALTDLSFAGAAIEFECQGYNSYKLEKHESKFMEFHCFFKTFGYSNLQSIIKDDIFKNRIESKI